MIQYLFSSINKSKFLSKILKTCKIVVSDSDFILQHS